MKNSGINWTNHTFNPWHGCTCVSPGCTNCYAKNADERKLHEDITHWGPGEPRMLMSDRYWLGPLSWDRAAAKAGERHRVFCASMGDWADEEGPVTERERLFNLIQETPNLDWLLLTKRPQNITKYLPSSWGNGWHNVWLGVTVENRQHGLPRIDFLREIPAAIRFLSIEPLLEDLGEINLTGIHWAIIGGESGPGARPFDISWARRIIAQCQQNGVAPWVKQLGRKPADSGSPFKIIGQNGAASGHADDFERWPEHLQDLKIRELPQPDFAPFATTQNEVGICRMESALGQLAADAELAGQDAAEEKLLRKGLVGVEQRLFLNRSEKANIIRAYHQIYAPRGLFKRFLDAVEIPKQTAYDWLQHSVPGESTETVLSNSGKDIKSVTEKPKKKPATAGNPVKIAAAIQRRLQKLDRKTQIKILQTIVVDLGLSGKLIQFPGGGVA